MKTYIKNKCTSIKKRFLNSNHMLQIKFIRNNMHDVESEAFLIFWSFVLAVFIVGGFFLALAFSGYISSSGPTFLDRARNAFSATLFCLGIFLIYTYISLLNSSFRLFPFVKACVILVCDIVYFVFLSSIHNILFDIAALFLSLYMVAYFIHTTFFLTKIMYQFVKKMFITLTHSDTSSGLKKVIEGITSIILALTAMFLGIGGLIAAFETLVTYFSS